jgi:hypothetical protein
MLNILRGLWYLASGCCFHCGTEKETRYSGMFDAGRDCPKCCDCGQCVQRRDETEKVRTSGLCLTGSHTRCKGDYSWLNPLDGPEEFHCECDCHNEK